MQINLCRTPTAMTEEQLDRFNGNALFQQTRCKRMPQDVGCEFATEAALFTGRPDHPGQGTVGDRQTVRTGKDPLGIAINLPCFTQEFENVGVDRNDAFPIAFSDVTKEHCLGIDGGYGKCGRFADAKSAGVHYRGTGTMDRMLNGGEESAALVVRFRNRKPELPGSCDFFFVKMAQSCPSVR